MVDMERLDQANTAAPRRNRGRGLAMLALPILAAQCLLTARATSVTFDEPAYIAAGYLYLTRGAFDVDREHPPLMKYLLALPLLFLELLPPEQVPNWNAGAPHQYTYGASFLFENREDPDKILFAARCPVVVVSILLGLLVWTWAQKLYGRAAAGVTLLLYSFCPNIVAHSSLATIDLGLSAGICAAFYALWRLYRRPTLRSSLVAGVGVAAALLVKCSAMLVLGLVPLLLVAAIAQYRRNPAAMDEGARDGGGHDSVSCRATATRLIAVTLCALLVAVILIACAWGPRHFGLARYASAFNLVVFHREMLVDPTYLRFCWGHYSAEGFPWYFLAAFLVKTPLPALILTLGLFGRLITRRPRYSFDELFVAAPIGVFLLATVFVRENIGLRYILPIYPLLYILLGGTAVALWDRVRRTGPFTWTRVAAAVAAAGLACWYVGGTLRLTPHCLAFFNEAVGGPAQGIRYLDDSNIDWGQDLKTLARYLRDHQIPHIRLVYIPTYLAHLAVPYYGISAEGMTYQEIRTPQKGWYAISAHVLQRPSLGTGYDGENIRFDWLGRFEPVSRIGYSIYLYRFD